MACTVCGCLQSNDIAMMSDMAKYLNNQGDANDGRHNPIPHLFWWAWNANSIDTGGLVSSPNWDTVSPHALSRSLYRKSIRSRWQLQPLSVPYFNGRAVLSSTLRSPFL